MENLFLAQAQTGKNEWWRYLLGVLLIFIIWPVGAFIAGVIMAIAMGGNPFEQASPIRFALMLASFAFLLVGTWFINQRMHGRSVKSLTTPFERVNWKRIGLGAALWLVAMTIVSIIEALLYPGRYVVNANPASVLPYFLVALVFIPIQTSAEEYFFRGYLLQATGRLLRQPIVLAVLNGLLFALPHLANPEVGVMGLVLSVLFYALIGFFFAYVTLRTQTLELALGIHAANNLFTGVFANYTTSALPTESFFLIQTLDPVYGLVSLSVVIVVFIALLSTGWMKNLLELE